MSRPVIAILTTGGTIAGAASSSTDTTGYTAGSLPAEALLEAVPELADIAICRLTPLFNIDSKDVSEAHWRTLVTRSQHLLDNPNIDAIVIAHGTDTLEESAFLLSLTLDSTKPVVLTGAMRPATALSADGPLNLYDAVCTAAHPDSCERGVIVCFNRMLFSGLHTRKWHNRSLDAFCGGEAGRIGQTAPLRYDAPPAPRPARLHWPTGHPLPRVDILYVGGGMSPDLLDASLAAGARGIVLALPGNGSLPEIWETPVRHATERGIPVIRASRCMSGEVSPRQVDSRIGTRPAGSLTPAQARIRLALELIQNASSP